jgi:hypothetical protein
VSVDASHWFSHGRGRQPGPTGLFQATSSYDADPNNDNNPGFRQVSWRTTDGGLSWVGTYISNERSVFSRGACWWGDYIGLASDRFNTAFFHAWPDPNITPPDDWVIRGRAINE